MCGAEYKGNAHLFCTTWSIRPLLPVRQGIREYNDQWPPLEGRIWRATCSSLTYCDFFTKCLGPRPDEKLTHSARTTEYVRPILYEPSHPII